MKKIFMIVAYLLLAENLSAAAWTGSTTEPANMKKIDGKSFYVITNADELAWFAAQVNGGKTSINAVLNNDIIFGSSKTSVCAKPWTPIGKDSSHIFNGIIDGGNYSVYGLYVTDVKFAGLIGIMGSNGIARKITLTAGKIVAKKDGYTGGIVGINSGKIDVATNSSPLSGSSVGGVVGWNASTGSISNSKNTGTLTLSGDGGGIAYLNEGSILLSTNKAKISASVTRKCSSNGYDYAYYYLGGVVSKNKNVIEGASNEGVVDMTSVAQGNIQSFTNGSVSKCGMTVTTYQGGITGINYSNAKISKSSNTVSLTYSGSGNATGKGGTSTGVIGGLAGKNQGQLNNTFNTSSRSLFGENSGTITNSYSVGGTSYWTNNVQKSSTTENMKKDQFAWVLNTTDGTKANSGIWSRNDGYPFFANSSYKPIYKVIFNDDGATSNRYTNYKGLVTFPNNPEPAEGFIFSGWYNANDTKVKSTTVFTADQTVNAVYVDASDVFWTINFYNAAPADTLLESKLYQHGSIVTYGGDVPTKTATAQYSYTFKGWDVEPTNAVEDFNYHAVYDSTIRSYTIAFNNFDGSKIENATFEYGKMPSCSKTPTRAATAEWKWTHKGWKPALDYVTGEASYTAIYDSVKVEYKVTFMNGVDVIDEQMVPYGDAAVAPTNVTREGYKFIGWNTSFSKVTENLTVKALFEELIIRTINLVDNDGESIANQNVEDGEIFILPEAPVKEGHTFDAYYDGNTKLGVAGESIPITGNITIVARYIVNEYVVSFVNADKTVLQSSNVAYGTIPSAPTNPTKAATVEYIYEFFAWSPEIVAVTGPATYTAVYDSSKVMYKVVFMNGTEIIKEQMVPYGGAAEAPTNVSREGYKFIGWNTAFEKITSALTVNALFEEQPSSSSVAASSSSSIPKSSSSSIVASSSSVKSSSSEAKSSSSKVGSSSSAKTDAITANLVSRFTVQVYAHVLRVSEANVGDNCALFDMQGRLLYQGRVVASDFKIEIPVSGTYLMRIGNSIKKVTVK